MAQEYLLTQALKGEVTQRIPFWFMRQAGRYLPEYKQVRATTQGFMDLCFTPEKAAEVTLQPIRRFGMDAAILFSDILVIPYGLGADVRFAEGEGPIVEQTITAERIGQLRHGDVLEKLAPIAETVRLVRAQLPSETALIGFCGSPWTVACYMLEGARTKKEFERARRFAYSEPVLMEKLIHTLTEASIDYLRMQIDAGANAVQLFDSWAGLLTPSQFERWVIAPTKIITDAVRRTHPNIPMIGFAKGAGAMLPAYARATGVDAIGIDQHTPMSFGIHSRAHEKQAVQGNLDPLALAASAEESLTALEGLLQTVAGVPCVLNLGHGFVPDTPIAHVEAVAERIKNYRRVSA